MTGCLLDVIQPETTSSGHQTDVIGTDILSPTVFDYFRMTGRLAAAAMNMVFAVYGFPVSFWNSAQSVVLPTGTLNDNFAATRMANYPWQIQRMRNLFINTSAKVVPPTANGANLIREALARFAGVKFCEDSFGNDVFSYRVLPTGTTKNVPNPDGGNEPLYPFGGILMLLGGVVCDSMAYVPGVLTGIEVLSVFSKSNPKTLALWPPPLTSQRPYVLKPSNANPIQGVVNGVTVYSYPMQHASVTLMGSNQMFTIPDEMYWTIRYCINTDISGNGGFFDAITMSEYAGSKSTAPRNILFNSGAGSLTGLAHPQAQSAGLASDAQLFCSNISYHETFFPAVDISGARHYMFINPTGLATSNTWSQWLGGSLLIWASTKLFTAQPNPIQPVEGVEIIDSWDVDYKSDTLTQGQNASKDEVPEQIAGTSSSSSSSSIYSASSTSVETPSL
jgi:hypothetical protein